ncbi:unnamed protein product, partial [Candidula unifasciata]
IPLLMELGIVMVIWVTVVLPQPNNYMCQEAPSSVLSCVEQLSNLSANVIPRPDDSRFGHNFTTNCASLNNRFFSGLHNKSLCPWTYHNDYNFNRFPHQMIFARCLCGKCSLNNGIQHECRPLYQAIHVIRRSAYEMLPKACVCSYRETHLVDVG